MRIVFHDIMNVKTAQQKHPKAAVLKFAVFTNAVTNSRPAHRNIAIVVV